MHIQRPTPVVRPLLSKRTGHRTIGELAAADERDGAACEGGEYCSAVVAAFGKHPA